MVAPHKSMYQDHKQKTELHIDNWVQTWNNLDQSSYQKHHKIIWSLG